jgi:hypothetical protein
VANKTGAGRCWGGGGSGTFTDRGQVNSGLAQPQMTHSAVSTQNLAAWRDLGAFLMIGR